MGFVSTRRINKAYKILKAEKKKRYEVFLAQQERREMKMSEMDFVMEVIRDLSEIPIDQPKTKQENLL